jgi:hypothetical protein
MPAGGREYDIIYGQLAYKKWCEVTGQEFNWNGAYQEAWIETAKEVRVIVLKGGPWGNE